MSSPWKKKQPEVVVDAILKRAEVGKVHSPLLNIPFPLPKPPNAHNYLQIGRTLKARLALAQFKVNKGWQDLTLDTIEPKIEEQLRARRPMSSGNTSTNSSSSASELRYSTSRNLMSSPLKEAPAIFSDQIGSRSRSGSSSGYRKRNYNSFEHPSSNNSARKRFRSSPPVSRPSDSTRTPYQVTQSSPIKPRTHFTNPAGPGVSFSAGSLNIPADFQSTNFAAASDDEEDLLPAHSFQMRSSPPRTPPPVRSRSNGGRRNKDKNGKSGEEGADLLLYLATSPSPANPTSRARMQAPSTPPSKNLALPSSMMTTPSGHGSGLLSAFGGPNTPGQNFDFSDFVNITPSPAQNAWPKTPRTVKTPLTVARRRLTFENFLPPNSSPTLRDHSNGAAKGLGMQLGGDLIS